MLLGPGLELAMGFIDLKQACLQTSWALSQSQTAHKTCSLVDNP